MSNSTMSGSVRDRAVELIQVMTGDEKHEASAASTLDVLVALYDGVLRVSPATIDDPTRDRFLLSKGHGPMAYYAVLAAMGFIDPAILPSFGAYGSILGRHPDRTLVPGVEISSGSLGHGLPIAVGLAHGLAVRGAASAGARVFCLVGDAELEEGSNHEAIALAGRLGLERLYVVVVDNTSSTYGWPGGIAARFELEGWSARTVDGRSRPALDAAFRVAHPGRPHVVIAMINDVLS